MQVVKEHGKRIKKLDQDLMPIRVCTYKIGFFEKVVPRDFRKMNWKVLIGRIDLVLQVNGKITVREKNLS